VCHHPSEARAITLISGGSGVSDRTFDVELTEALLPVFEATPEEASRGTVIIVHDIYGAREFYRNLARRFAGVGYTALLPDLFVRQGPLAEDTREAAFERRERFSYPQAIDDLQRLIDAIVPKSGNVGTVGFCMGGTLGMLLTARESRVAASVIYYGFPANPTPDANQPWEPLQEAERVQSPLLGFWGDQDHGVGMENVEAYRQALRAGGKTFDFTIYPGLPHGFLAFDGSKPYLDESNDSWDKMLAFYRDYLG
jgi:carboxymethylenebutenolidase